MIVRKLSTQTLTQFRQYTTLYLITLEWSPQISLGVREFSSRNEIKEKFLQIMLWYLMFTDGDCIDGGAGSTITLQACGELGVETT